MSVSKRKSIMHGPPWLHDLNSVAKKKNLNSHAHRLFVACLRQRAKDLEQLGVDPASWKLLWRDTSPEAHSKMSDPGTFF
jgi:hypothetical protein